MKHYSTDLLNGIDTLPRFIDAAQGSTKQSLADCWYKYHQYTPEAMAAWLDGIESESYLAVVKHHLQQCEAWIWLTQLNRISIEREMLDLDKETSQQMRECLNELLPFLIEWRKEQRAKIHG